MTAAIRSNGVDILGIPTLGYVLGSRRSHKLGTWCGYTGIIRVVVHCFRVHCNGRLLFHGCCDSLPRKERAGRTAHRQLGLSACIGMRARPSRFSVAEREREREKPRGLYCLVGLSPLLEMVFLPPSVGLFLFLFFAFFFSGYQRFSALLMVVRR